MSLGKLLVVSGVLLVVVGVLVMSGARLPRLPGDIVFRFKNGTIYFPIVTCIVLSVVLTLLSWIFRRFF